MLVRIESKFQDKIVFKSGVELYQDTWMEHREKVTLSGEVVHLAPSDGRVVKKGDKVYFRYDVVGDSSIIEGHIRYHNLIPFDGEDLWHVSLAQLFAKEVDGEIESIGDVVIGVQDIKQDTWESSILVKTQLDDKIDRNRMTVKYNGGGFKKGDRLYVNGPTVGKYNFSGIFGDDLAVVSKHNIIGYDDTKIA